MRTTLLTISALVAAAATATAQGASAIRLRLDPGSELTIEGTSSGHDFTCKTTRINAYVDVDPGYAQDLTRIARPIVSVKVNIPVRTLTCGKGAMDNNMYKTLGVDKNPLIQYTLTGYDLFNGSASGFAANTKGTLTIAGKQRPLDMKITAERVANSKTNAKGESNLLMTDFGIKPPSFMFGAMKVSNEIKVKFNLKAGPELLAQLEAVSNGKGQ
jgi:polyisoprenoid-binding protein YceI